jgi:hypothetical protein
MRSVAASAAAELMPNKLFRSVCRALLLVQFITLTSNNSATLMKIIVINKA